jgi:hypothetical protein
MDSVGIKSIYGIKYEPKKPEFWEKIGWQDGADVTYICMGVKASNYFMPSETLSDKGIITRSIYITVISTQSITAIKKYLSVISNGVLTNIFSFGQGPVAAGGFTSTRSYK